MGSHRSPLGPQKCHSKLTTAPFLLPNCWKHPVAAKTDGGTKHYRKVEDKEKREDSDSSVYASPELQKSQPVMGKEKDKAKTTPPPRKQTKSKQEKNKPRK